MIQLKINNNIIFEITSYQRTTLFGKLGHSDEAYVQFEPNEQILNQLRTLPVSTNEHLYIEDLALIYYDENNKSFNYNMPAVKAEIFSLNEIWIAELGRPYIELTIVFPLE